MYFDSLKSLENIIKNSGTVVIALEDGDNVLNDIFDLGVFIKKLNNCIIVRPGITKNLSGKINNFITIDQIREVISKTNVKQTSDFYIFFDHADTIREDGENTMLKLLEEPKDNYHFILLTDTPETLLQTIKSRAEIYRPIKIDSLDRPPKASDEVLNISKRLLAADTKNIIEIADMINKKKPEDRREFALEILNTTIELAYKSYYKTYKSIFLKKINGMIAAYNNIKLNGNPKLQIVANLC